MLAREDFALERSTARHEPRAVTLLEADAAASVSCLTHPSRLFFCWFSFSLQLVMVLADGGIK